MQTPLRDADDFVVHCPICLLPLASCHCSINKWIVEEGYEAQDWLPEYEDQ